MWLTSSKRVELTAVYVNGLTVSVQCWMSMWAGLECTALCPLIQWTWGASNGGPKRFIMRSAEEGLMPPSLAPIPRSEGTWMKCSNWRVVTDPGKPRSWWSFGAELSCLKTSGEQQEENRRCKSCSSVEHCLLHTPKEANMVGTISSFVNSKGFF